MHKINSYVIFIIALFIAFFCAAYIFLIYPNAIPLKPELKIKLYKIVHVNYSQIFKGKPSIRFNDKDLAIAIKNAKQQFWVQQQIKNDFTPYTAGITAEQVNRWFTLQQDFVNRLVKFTVKKGKVTTHSLGKMYTNNNAFSSVADVIIFLAKKGYIPDCEFIISMNDYLVPTGKSNESAAILTFAKHKEISIEKDTILIPDWLNLQNWDSLRPRINLANQIYPWENKLPIIHWRGGCADSMQHRQKLVALNAKLKFIDAHMTGVSNQMPFLDPEFSLQYKYQISLDGARSTWERVIWQMHSNAVLLKPYSPQIQWFHAGLEPYKNYVPIENIDEKSISKTYKWLINHDREVQTIIANANEFAEQNLNTIDMVAYYAIVLQEYGRLYKN